MPTATNGSVSLYYDRAGTGEPIVFVSEAGFGGWLWGWQHAALAGPYESIVWDLRGTGRSDAPPGPYSIETLADDLGTVLAACDVRSGHLVGCGLGGLVSLWAARSSNRIETLTLFGTAARGDAMELDRLKASPDDRDALDTTVSAALSADFLDRQPDVRDGIVDWRADDDATLAGWNAQLAALDGSDATDWLVSVPQPTQVIHGTDDTIVAPAAGNALAAGLPRGEYVPVDGAGHCCFIEQSRTVNDRLRAFFDDYTGEI